MVHTCIELEVLSSKAVLDANGLDKLLAKLAEVRADMRPEVPSDLEKVTTVAQVDPAWRTYPSLHPGVGGLTLNLRHAGYGWLGFVLPYKEAFNLGQWLRENAGRSLEIGKPKKDSSDKESHQSAEGPIGE